MAEVLQSHFDSTATLDISVSSFVLQPFSVYSSCMMYPCSIHSSFVHEPLSMYYFLRITEMMDIVHPVVSASYESFGIDDTVPIQRARVFHKLCTTGSCTACTTQQSKCKQPRHSHGYYLFHYTAFIKMLEEKLSNQQQYCSTKPVRLWYFGSLHSNLVPKYK